MMAGLIRPEALAGTEFRFGGPGLAFEVAGEIPEQTLDPRAWTPPPPAGARRVRLRAVPVPARDPRFLDPFGPEPMVWSVAGRQLSIRGRCFACETNLDELETGEIPFWFAEDGDAHAFNGTVSNLLRVLIAIGRIRPECLILHSSSMITSGMAALLYGPSGAGKSTFGRLAREAGFGVASDDLNLLHVPREGSLELQAFPFSGDYGPRSWDTAATFPVGAILRLEKADENEVLPLDQAEALAGLASCSPFMNGDPSLFGELLDLLTEVTKRVALWRLRFRQDLEAPRLVAEVLRR